MRRRGLVLARDVRQPASVGQDGRLLLADGSILPNVFALGLGAGYRSTGRMGGEPNFSGQQNSLWLLQNDIGQIIYEGVRALLQDRRQAA